MAFGRRVHHETLAMQRNAGIGQEVFDFQPGDRVMTVDGFPGKVVAMNSGPYPGTEDYEVSLDGGMGGGTYTTAQLKRISETTAALHEAAEITASIPVEAVTSHTADLDYPELGTILYDRLPNENVKIAANKDNTAQQSPDDSDDPTERLDQQEDDEETGEEDENSDTKAAEEPANEAGKDEDDAGPPDLEAEKEKNTPDVTPPSACSFCGNAEFEDPQMTGRGVRMRCAQCGGTMKSWGGQWEPEFPNSSENHASGASDWSQGGAAGVANAPGANFKTTSLDVEAGIINYIVDKIYDAIEQRKDHAMLKSEWAWDQEFEGNPHYDLNVAHNHALGPVELNHPLTIHGSLADDYDEEWGFHFTASWSDVQNKARRIRREGHVRIVSASKTFVVGEVQGDHHTYESELNYLPGTKKVAYWSCGCKWASYAWGRSPQYKRFEGRLCSHALALQYEAGSRGMFGKDVYEDSDRLPGQHQRSPVTVQYDKGVEKNRNRRTVPPGNMRRTFSSLSLDTDGIYESPELLDLYHAPIYASVRQMIEHGEETTSVIEMLASFRVTRESAKEMVFEALKADDAGINRDGDEYETPDGDRFNHGDPDNDDDKSQWDDPEYVRANQRDLSDHEDDHAADEHKRLHHHTNDAREHAPHWGWGLPAGVPIETCPQCNGSGCGHCAGQGQIVSGQSNLTSASPDQNSDSGDVVSGLATNGSIHTADYSSSDPLAGVDSQTYYSPTDHSNSKNPASTGWATSQDPGDWGTSVITNNFGLTTDAALDAPTNVAGVALRAKDTGRVLMLQRGNHDEEDPARGTWEFPGGHHEEGDLSSLHAAVREWEEEVGQPFPQGGSVVHTWRSGPYRGHVVEIPNEHSIDFSQGRQIENPDGDHHEQAAWWEIKHAKENPALRKELQRAPWDQIHKAAEIVRPDGVTHCKNCALRTDDLDPRSGQCARCDTLLNIDDRLHREPAGGSSHAWWTREQPFQGQHEEFSLQGYHPGRSHMYSLNSKSAGRDDICGNCGEHVHESNDPNVPWVHSHSGNSYCDVNDTHDAVLLAGSPLHRPESHPVFHEATLLDDPDEVGALPYTEGGNDIYPGQTGGSSGDSSLPHASEDALNTGMGDHTTDSLHMAFLNSPGARAIMADLGISKSAMKDFSYAEQQELIDEGKDLRARNFGDLKIAGTHYEMIPDDEDNWF